MCLFAAPVVAGGVAQAGIAVGSAAVATALNSMIIAAASAAFSAQQQSKNAKAVSQHQKQQYKLQGEISRADAINKYAALGDQSRERELAMGHALEQNKRKALEASSLTELMAGEGGIQGKSVGLLLTDVEKQNQDYQMALIQQEKFHDAQFIRQGQGIQAGQYASLLAAAPDPVPEPNYLGALAGVVAQGWSSYNRVKLASID